MVIDLPTFCHRPTGKFKYLPGSPKKIPAKKNKIYGGEKLIFILNFL
jgi:hypothetical protein